MKNFEYVTNDPFYNEKYVSCLEKVDTIVNKSEIQSIEDLENKIISLSKKITELKDIIKGKDKIIFEDEIRNLNEQQTQDLTVRLDAFFKMI